MNRSRWGLHLARLLIGLAAAVPALGQAERAEREERPLQLADRPVRPSGEGDRAHDELTGSVDDYLTARTRELSQAANEIERAGQAVDEAIDRSVPAAVAAKTTSTAPPDAFADRIGDAIADFLPLFQFAVDSVSTAEDRRSVTLKANPIRGHLGALSTQITLAEPEVHDALAEQIAEPVRNTQKEALLQEVGDYGDLTASLQFGFHRSGRDWGNSRWLLGRDYSLYEGLVGQLVAEAWERVSRPAQDRMQATTLSAAKLFDDPPCRLFDAADGDAPFENSEEVTFEAIRELERADPTRKGCLEAIVHAFDSVAAAMADLTHEVRAFRFDALPALIDNQPQLVATGSYRFADEVVAPESWSIGAQYEMGSDNFNRLLREVRSGRSPFDAYLDMTANRERVEDASKLVFGFTYTRTDDHDFTHPYRVPGADGQVDLSQPALTASISLPRSEVWRGKLLYTRFMPEMSPEPAQRVGVANVGSADPLVAAAAAAGLVTPEERPRFTAGFEFLETDDPSRQDQIIGRVSYVLPLKGGLTLPVTLSWANKGEFLGDQEEVIGGHVGISYGFDRKK